MDLSRDAYERWEEAKRDAGEEPGLTYEEWKQMERDIGGGG